MSNKDTLTVVVFDTITEVVYDTSIIIVFDTVKVFDSLRISKKNKNGIPSRYSYEMYFSPSISSFTKVNENTNHSIYNDSMVNCYYSGFGMRLNNSLTKKFKIFGGIEYGESICNLNYEFDTITVKKLIKDSLNYWKYSKVLTYYKYIEGYDTIWVTLFDSTQTTFNYQTDNSSQVSVSPSNQSVLMRYISIPIGAEYELFNTNKFSMTVGAGLKTIFLIYSKGYIVDESNRKFLEVNDFSRKINFSYSFFAKTKYKIVKNTSIFCEPHFNFFVNSSLKNFKPIIKDKYLGVNVGFSFVF